MNQFGKQVHRRGASARQRNLSVPDNVRENASDIRMADLSDVMIRTEKTGHRALPCFFVENRIFESDRKSVEMIRAELLHDGGNNGGIKPPAQIGANGNARREAFARCIRKQRCELLFISFDRFERRLPSPVWI